VLWVVVRSVVSARVSRLDVSRAGDPHLRTRVRGDKEVAEADVMESQNVQVITSAVAPIVMVSAAGLLFMGIQAKNLHLADRVRMLMAEYRTVTLRPTDDTRRAQIVEQLVLFNQRIHLSQRALELIYIAIVCFVLTSLLLAAAPWVSGLVVPAITAGVFIIGVVFLLLALLLEYREMHLGLRTVGIEIGEAVGNRRGD
jgi:uncharacterized protein DUF2721